MTNESAQGRGARCEKRCLKPMKEATHHPSPSLVSASVRLESYRKRQSDTSVLVCYVSEVIRSDVIRIGTISAGAVNMLLLRYQKGP